VTGPERLIPGSHQGKDLIAVLQPGNNIPANKTGSSGNE
jgi:hypothetical protein